MDEDYHHQRQLHEHQAEGNSTVTGIKALKRRHRFASGCKALGPSLFFSLFLFTAVVLLEHLEKRLNKKIKSTDNFEGVRKRAVGGN